MMFHRRRTLALSGPYIYASVAPDRLPLAYHAVIQSMHSPLYRLMSLGRAAPVVNAQLPLTESNVVSEDCGRGRGPSWRRGVDRQERPQGRRRVPGQLMCAAEDSRPARLSATHASTAHRIPPAGRQCRLHESAPDGQFGPCCQRQSGIRPFL